MVALHLSGWTKWYINMLSWELSQMWKYLSTRSRVLKLLIGAWSCIYEIQRHSEYFKIIWPLRQDGLNSYSSLIC